MDKEAQAAVLLKTSAEFEKNTATHQVVKGFDFESEDVNLDSLLNSYFSCGFQATNVALAVAEINRMVLKMFGRKIPFSYPFPLLVRMASFLCSLERRRI
jgi:deoxyhypusine synthase